MPENRRENYLLRTDYTRRQLMLCPQVNEYASYGDREQHLLDLRNVKHERFIYSERLIKTYSLLLALFLTEASRNR